MSLPSTKPPRAIAPNAAATPKTQAEIDYAKFLAEAIKDKPELRRELQAKIETALMAASGVGKVEVNVFYPRHTDNHQHTRAYLKVWKEVVAVWAAAQRQKGYKVAIYPIGMNTIYVRVTCP